MGKQAAVKTADLPDEATSSDQVTISRDDFESLRDTVAAMRAEIKALKEKPTVVAVAAPTKAPGVSINPPNPDYKNMTKVISMRSFTLYTRKGHVVAFEGKKPKYIPNAILPEAMERGVVPVDEADIEAFDDRRKARVEFQGDLRRSVIALFIADIVDQNNARDFDAAGTPKYQELSKLAGFSVTQAEALEIFRAVEASRKSGEEPNIDPKALTVKRIIEADTNQDLLALLPETRLKHDDVSGMQTRDMRKAMLSTFSGMTYE